MSNLFKKKHNGERGEIMIEGMIVMVITMFILIWILGLGFLYYQRYVTTVVTNDAAVKIASTYNNPTSDIIMGYVTTEDISNRDLYRGFTVGSNSSDLHTVNEDRAESYVKYVLDTANSATQIGLLCSGNKRSCFLHPKMAIQCKATVLAFSAALAKAATLAQNRKKLPPHSIGKSPAAKLSRRPQQKACAAPPKSAASLL